MTAESATIPVATSQNLAERFRVHPPDGAWCNRQIGRANNARRIRPDALRQDDTRFRNGFTYPVLMADAAVVEQFGTRASGVSALLALRPGVDPASFATRLQASLIASGVDATDLEHAVRQNFAANESFFQLMQGFSCSGCSSGSPGSAS